MWEYYKTFCILIRIFWWSFSPLAFIFISMQLFNNPSEYCWWKNQGNKKYESWFYEIFRWKHCRNLFNICILSCLKQVLGAQGVNTTYYIAWFHTISQQIKRIKNAFKDTNKSSSVFVFFFQKCNKQAISKNYLLKFLGFKVFNCSIHRN